MAPTNADRLVKRTVLAAAYEVHAGESLSAEPVECGECGRELDREDAVYVRRDDLLMPLCPAACQRSAV